MFSNGQIRAEQNYIAQTINSAIDCIRFGDDDESKRFALQILDDLVFKKHGVAKKVIKLIEQQTPLIALEQK